MTRTHGVERNRSPLPGTVISSALENQTDLSEGGPGFGEDPHATGAVRDVVGRGVRRDELELAKLGMGCEEAGADLVDEVLDGATVELVEDPLDLVANGTRSEKPWTLRHSVPQVAVTPVHIQMDRQGPIGELGKRRVVVARERRERAARRLHEPHPFPPAARGGDLRLSANRVDRDLRDRAVHAGRAEENAAGAVLSGGGVERHLTRRHAERLHNGIGLDEAPAEEGAEAEEGAARVLGGHRVHEILHRVGGDDLTIVALRVRTDEAVAEDIDVDRRGKRRDVGTAEPVEKDVGLAVADLGRGHGVMRSKRSRVIARNSSMPVASSSTRVRRRRSRMTGGISAFDRPATKATNRKPNLRSYSSFIAASSRRIATSAPPPCSRRERADNDAGSAPIRGWAFSTAMRSASVIRAISARADATIDAVSLPRTRSASLGARSKIAARSSGVIVIMSRGSS